VDTDSQAEIQRPHPPSVSETVYGGREIETAIDTPSKVRCALARLAAMVLDKQVSTKEASVAGYLISQGAAQNAADIAVEAIKQARALQVRREQRQMGMLSAVDAQVVEQS
jgi:hypothetical protein